MTTPHTTSELHRVQQMFAQYLFRREVRRKVDARVLLLQAEQRADRRRFSGQPITGFGGLEA